MSFLSPPVGALSATFMAVLQMLMLKRLLKPIVITCLVYHCLLQKGNSRLTISLFLFFAWWKCYTLYLHCKFLIAVKHLLTVSLSLSLVILCHVILLQSREWGLAWLGWVARSMVSANHWLRGIKTYRLSWYLTRVSANHASSNWALENNWGKLYSHSKITLQF